ncbi:MAG: phosphotriesterase-related protein [Phycisphaerales bacterium]|jgi:phosphotriesterase-related protein|nr:phosphotriesterase-related protein [Phycisphaerales bacterium]
MQNYPDEIITVLGPIAPGELGVTQTHEHLILDAYDHYKSYDLVIDDEELVVEELKEFTSRGGKTIVDVTLDEIGRNPEALRRVSRASGVQVVMGCGWYREFGYPDIVREKTSNELADVLVREIEVGVGESGIRAGIIGEIGTGRHHILPAEERVFRAAAIAQRRTGVAITTHTTRWGTLAMEQIAMLEEFGADLSKVIIGHLGDRRGVQHLLPIAHRGVYLEVDNIGYLDYQPEWVRADNVAALCKEGFSDKILLSEDICMLGHLKYRGGKGYGYLLEVFVPLLKQRGVSDEQIHQMLVVNPARAISRRRPDAK